MSDSYGSIENRRQFLRFLAGTPLFAGSAMLPLLARKLWAADELPAELITAAEDALNVFDFHPVAKTMLSPAHYGYTVSGTDGDETLLANREGFERFRIECADSWTSAMSTRRLKYLVPAGRRRSRWRPWAVRESTIRKVRLRLRVPLARARTRRFSRRRRHVPSRTWRPRGARPSLSLIHISEPTRPY